MRHGPGRALRRDTRGAVAVEFALVALLFLTVTFGLVWVGLSMWSVNALQTAANTTARCRAIGSPECADAARYAADLVSRWGLGGFVSSTNVTVSTGVACGASPGLFVRVAISAGADVTPLFPLRVSVRACHPMQA